MLQSTLDSSQQINLGARVQDFQTHFTENNEYETMKLGVYERPTSNDEPITRLALYDFEAGEWDESSSGRIVAHATATPSPEELKVKFEVDQDVRNTIVRTPEQLSAIGREIVVKENAMSVADGHAKREERNGPMLTQTEMEYRDQQNVVVFPDDFDVPEVDRQLAEKNGDTIVRESDWDGLDFAEEFNFDFEPIDSETGSVEKTR